MNKHLLCQLKLKGEYIVFGSQFRLNSVLGLNPPEPAL